jgi:hypothetical protein
MTSQTPTDVWHEINAQGMRALLVRPRAALERLVHESQHADGAPATSLDDLPPALASLSRAFDLSPFERDLLVLCAGVEVDPTLANLCASAQPECIGYLANVLPGADSIS